MSEHEEKDQVRAEVLTPGGPTLDTQIVLNIEGLGAVTLPRGLKPQNFPRHSFENIALAMKKSTKLT